MKGTGKHHSGRGAVPVQVRGLVAAGATDRGTLARRPGAEWRRRQGWAAPGSANLKLRPPDGLRVDRRFFNYFLKMKVKILTSLGMKGRGSDDLKASQATQMRGNHPHPIISRKCSSRLPSLQKVRNTARPFHFQIIRMISYFRTPTYNYSKTYSCCTLNNCWQLQSVICCCSLTF